MFESIAYAAAPAQHQAEGNPIISFLPIILMVFILYFLMVRPQQKRQRELQKMITELKKGDCVVTAGGIIGTITSVQNDYVVLKVGDGDTKMEVLKSAISGLRTKSE
ncbi:MAG: preprotein translocase subunit YajC [Candidatus Omnitrophica bacterium]|nr:preprotein translocase subunit YajC [Candidatus Omnitrophota bacterium]MDD5672171.1 preprotein translocase subunit YajC [Candidatus Omnitrophota bacterium]